jgi:poly-gamma-glutamate synthesis protein (capsule biosynthesis protein)
MKFVLFVSGMSALLVASFAYALVRETGEVAVIESVAQQRPVTILAFGDMMLDRTVRDAITAHGAYYPFERIAPLLLGHDIVVANAEGPFTNHKSISAVDHSQLVFTFDPSSLPMLKSLGFTMFSQANNHALNFGWDGLHESQAAITNAGIGVFGDPENADPGPVYQTVRGETVAFVGYDQFSSSGGSASSTLAAIRIAKQNSTFVIVYAHWGEEYNLGTTQLQANLAHAFIDAGADAVLGSHPHVVEPIELYAGKFILYSMGNFVFDQDWDDNVSHGLAVDISLTDTQASYRLVPYAIGDMQPYLEGTTTSFVLAR